MGVRRARVWRAAIRREDIAWSRSFQKEGVLWEKQRLETRTCPSSGLGNPNPFSWTHRPTSTARASGGSPRSSDAFTASITRLSSSPPAPSAASSAAAISTAAGARWFAPPVAEARLREKKAGRQRTAEKNAPERETKYTPFVVEKFAGLRGLPPSDDLDC